MAKKKKTLQRTSTQELMDELRRRERRLPRLQRKRDQLLEQLEEVEREIEELGGESRGRGRGRAGRSSRTKKAGRSGGGRKRPQNEMPLGDMLVKVMRKGQTYKVSDLVNKVQEAGYKTTASNFSTIVNQTLIKDERFQQKSRGHYTLS